MWYRADGQCQPAAVPYDNNLAATPADEQRNTAAARDLPGSAGLPTATSKPRANGNRPAHYGIRTDRYKLIFFYGLPLDKTTNEPTKPGWELYDLAKDPNEMDNVYDDPAYRDATRRLEQALLEKKEELGDIDEDPELLERRAEFFG